MKLKISVVAVLFSCLAISGCYSSRVVEGYVVGSGIGYVLGDAKLGGQLGATAGLLQDIWD